MTHTLSTPPSRKPRRVRITAVLVAAFAAGSLTVGAQQAPSTAEPLHQAFDQLLDLYVRDGLVYYAALKSDRAKLDRYVASLSVPGAAGLADWPRDRQLAFWLNAYNAFVLQTVVSHYPIGGAASTYPSGSIRQIPGAFERLPHRAGGRTVTLDGIEKEILPAFRDPRVYLALGRGALGSGRLRSEAYSADRIDQQLKEVAAETVTRPELWRVDALQNRVMVSPIFSWRGPDFIAAYASDAGPYSNRSPIERAVLSFVSPFLLPAERQFITANRFEMAFSDFDWRLNDLGSRGR